ncbi:hypothetical protein GCM10010300_22910 [Streptomyces olivaceoviridis]|nr:hypothetical protein GCM10010300_22910 [Streptomyces olivaceoviridis]
MIAAAHAQLRLARPLATDLRRPWEKPTEPNEPTPARVRKGFRNPTLHSVGRVLAIGEAYSRPTHHRGGTKPRRIA